jgi:hypothetical protein
MSQKVKKCEFWTFKMAAILQGQGHKRSYTILYTVQPPRYVCVKFQVDWMNMF